MREVVAVVAAGCVALTLIAVFMGVRAVEKADAYADRIEKLERSHKAKDAKLRRHANVMASLAKQVQARDSLDQTLIENQAGLLSLFKGMNGRLVSVEENQSRSPAASLERTLAAYGSG